MREHWFNDDWYDYVYEDAIEIGKLIGITIKKIHFSGFWSQGDGACFEGGYEYVKGSVKAIKDYAPQDTELHNIATGLYDLQRRHFYSLYANVEHRGRDVHELCTDISVYNSRSNWNDEIDCDELRDLLRDFMRWIYKRLRDEYEYITSDEVLSELAEANEYQYTENGKIY